MRLSARNRRKAQAVHRFPGGQVACFTPFDAIDVQSAGILRNVAAGTPRVASRVGVLDALTGDFATKSMAFDGAVTETESWAGTGATPGEFMFGQKGNFLGTPTPGFPFDPANHSYLWLVAWRQTIANSGSTIGGGVA